MLKLESEPVDIDIGVGVVDDPPKPGPSIIPSMMRSCIIRRIISPNCWGVQHDTCCNVVDICVIVVVLVVVVVVVVVVDVEASSVVPTVPSVVEPSPLSVPEPSSPEPSVVSWQNALWFSKKTLVIQWIQWNIHNFWVPEKWKIKEKFLHVK